MSDFGAMWDFNDPAGSAGRFREAAGTAASDAECAECLSQLARAEGLQGNFAEGDRVLDNALGLLEGEPEGRAMLRIALERGRLRNSSGDAAAAVPLFREAMAIGERTGDEDLTIDAVHMLGIAAPPDERLSWNERALVMAEASSDPKSRRWIGPLLNNIGWTYHDSGEFSKALASFERAVIVRREAGEETQARIGEWSVGRVLRSLKRFDEALPIQLRLEREIGANGDSDPYISEEIAENLLALGRTDEAIPYFRSAYDGLITDTWFVANEAERLTRLKELGGVV